MAEENKISLWQPVDPENLPKGEVLARNQEGVLLGKIIWTADRNTGIACTNDDGFDTIWLDNVTHYITIENLLEL